MRWFNSHNSEVFASIFAILILAVVFVSALHRPSGGDGGFASSVDQYVSSATSDNQSTDQSQ